MEKTSAYNLAVARSWNLPSFEVGTKTMGILNLRFGFFLKLGAATVINDDDSSLNRDRQTHLLRFQHFFVANMHNISGFIPVNARQLDGVFEVLSDNAARETKNLERILTANGRFSIVVHCVENDLLSKNVLNEETFPQTEEMWNRCKRFELQIFSIKDAENPLTPAILARQDRELPFYLMENAARTRDKIERRLTAVVA